MHLTTMIMKFINKNAFFALAILPIIAFAQPQSKTKIDGVAAVVGDYIILDSDVDLMFLELKAQGASPKDFTRCELLGKLMEDKLYAHQAIQDSIVVTDAEVNEVLEDQLSQMVEQVGSMEKVIDYYKKKDEEDFRSYFFDIIKMNKLTSQMQKKIVDKIEITPEEVRNFFKEIPEADRPIFGAEMEVAQIVIKPTVSEEEKQKVIQKLKDLKNDVLVNGASFFSRAVLYSEDPGSRSNGGYYKMTRKTPFVKEFKDVAFSLNEGDISEPFETEFGFHIIYIEKIRGQELDLRHILIAPKVADAALKEAKERAETIRKRILDKEINFADAAKMYSDEKETKNNGGVLINPKTQEPRFELTKMDPDLYNQVSNLKDNEVSYVMKDEDRNGSVKYKIVTVNNRTDEHKADFSKDFLKIKELALKDKQIKAIAKWTDEKIKETYIKINTDYKSCEFVNNWAKK